MLTPVDDLQQVVDALAERLQRSVAVDDKSIRLVAHSRHFGDEDALRIQSVLGRGIDKDIADRLFGLGLLELTEPTRLAIPEFGVRARVCLPIRNAGLLIGYLWLMDDERLKDSEIAEAAATADFIGMMLYRREIAFERRHARNEASLRDLISSDEAARLAAADDLLEDRVVRNNASVSAVVVRIVGLAEAMDIGDIGGDIGAAVARTARQAENTVFGGTIRCLEKRSGVVLFGFERADTSRPRSIERIARRAVDELSSALGRRAVAGIGTSERYLHDARQSYQRAVVAARAAEHLPGLGDVTEWASLGVYALLSILPPRELLAAGYPDPLIRLMSARNAEVLLETAETYLDLAGDVQATAASLQVHRTTLYQRLSRLEEISHLDLRSGTDRLTLHLGIKLARLTGGKTGVSVPSV